MIMRRVLLLFLDFLVTRTMSTSFLTDDGCETEASPSNDFPAQPCADSSNCDGMTGAVRCCSMDGSTCISDCQNSRVGLQAAIANCAERGMRLCTPDEVRNGGASGRAGRGRVR